MAKVPCDARMGATNVTPTLAALDAIARANAPDTAAWADCKLNWENGAPNLSDQAATAATSPSKPAARYTKAPQAPRSDRTNGFATHRFGEVTRPRTATKRPSISHWRPDGHPVRRDLRDRNSARNSHPTQWQLVCCMRCWGHRAHRQRLPPPGSVTRRSPGKNTLPW